MKRLLIALAVLALGACGGSGSTDDNDGVASLGGDARNASAQKTEKEREQAWLDFARCMREHGIQMADPATTPDGGGRMVKIRPGKDDPAPPDKGKLEEAEKACGRHIEGLEGGSAPLSDPEMQDKLLKFAQCMREHGIDMPDPSGEGGRVQFEIREQGEDKLEAAHKACESVAPFKAGGDVSPAGPVK